MPVLTWLDFYSVGIERIDKEHRKVLDMVNKAYDAVAQKREQDVLDELVAEMATYAKAHFATENALMREHGYPKTEAHVREHEAFADEAEEAAQALRRGETLDPNKLFKFLADWLRGHILATDKELGTFLRGKGLR